MRSVRLAIALLVVAAGTTAAAEPIPVLCRDGRLPAQAPPGIVFGRATQAFGGGERP